MTKGLVSVVIPSKDRPDFLMEALDSVFAQTYQNLEVIVVDDGSTSPLKQMISETYGERVKCRRNETSLGAPAARNAGARLASGKYIAFLDDDDVWLPGKIDKQVAAFEAGESVGLVFCGEDIVCEGSLIKHRVAVWPPDACRLMYQKNVVGGTSTVLMRRALFLDFCFDESLPSCQDWDLFLRLSRVSDFKAIPDVVVKRRIHAEQISGTMDRRILGRKLFLEKHYEEIKNFPEALSQHLRRLGSFAILTQARSEAQAYFFKALRAVPLDWRNWVCFIVSRFPLEPFSTRFLTHFAVTRVGGYHQYH